jgi:chemotaxis protein MotB
MSSGKETGTKTLGANESISIDKANVDKLKEEIEKAILKQTELNKLSKQIEITITGEGLKIELIEDKDGTFFERGSPKLSENGVKLLDLLAGQLKVLPNHLLIEGHTDAQPFSSDAEYTNWELSSDRANSARRVLQEGGVGPNQISQVRGYADQLLRVPSNPLDPSNRRVSLIVKWVDASEAPADATGPPVLSEAKDSAVAADSKSAIAVPEKPDNPTADAAPKANPETSLPPATPSSVAKPAPAVAETAKPAWTDRVRALLPGKKK